MIRKTVLNWFSFADMLIICVLLYLKLVIVVFGKYLNNPQEF